MNKLFLLSVFLFITATTAQAEDPISIANRTILNHSLGQPSNQSFCLQGPDGNIQGIRTSQLQKIASVTKLFTSFVSLESFPADYRWETTFTLSKNRLHISGGRDPWFEGEKALALVAELKARGIKSLDEVSFDENFLFEDGEPETDSKPTPTDSADSLGLYFSRSGRLSQKILEKRKAYTEEMAQDGITIALASSGIPTRKIYFSSENPIKDQDAVSFTHHSRTLLATLKAMNVFSKNKVARNIWDFVSRRKNPIEILTEHDIPQDEIQLRNGSGLDIVTGSKRFDNKATCHAVMKLLDELDRTAEHLRLRIEDIAAFGNDPGGHFLDRFNSDPAVRNALVAKTGTLASASTLAGWLFGNQTTHFVILNESKEIEKARNAQDEFLIGLLQNGYGPLNPISNYTPISFFPLEDRFFN